jgi:hypothetical protein
MRRYSLKFEARLKEFKEKQRVVNDNLVKRIDEMTAYETIDNEVKRSIRTNIKGVLKEIKFIKEEFQNFKIRLLQ